MATDIAFVDKLKFILEITTSPQAQYFSALCIKSIFISHWNKIDIKVKAAFKNFLLSYLANKAGSFSLITVKAIVQCLTIIIKLAWFNDEMFQKTIIEVENFGTLSYNHQMITFITFDSLIQETNNYTQGTYIVVIGHSLCQSRRTSISFRDNYLGGILLYSLKSLASILEQLLPLPKAQRQSALELLLQCLKVVSGCFTYDFACRFDDTLDNFPYNQMPLSWNSILGNDTLIQPIFDVMFKVKSEDHQLLVVLYYT